MGEVDESEIVSTSAVHTSRNHLAHCSTAFVSFKTIVTDINLGEVLVIV